MSCKQRYEPETTDNQVSGDMAVKSWVSAFGDTETQVTG